MWIVIPDDVPIVDLDTGEPVLKDGKPVMVSMQKTLAQLAYTNPYLSDDGEEAAERIWRLRHAFFGKRPGDAVEVSEDDVKAVRAVFAKPDGDGKRTTGKCNGCGARQSVRWIAELAVFCVPHIRAWKAATHERPSVAVSDLRGAVEVQA